MRYCATLLALLLVFGGECRAQQTVFNVPSPDVLDRGVAYVELDLLTHPSDTSFTFTPRVVVGIGYRIEVGLNFIGPATPATGEYVLSPAVKWKLYDGGQNRWSLFAGDNLFVPIRTRSYDLGTHAYIGIARQFGTGTRLAAGAYYFSPHVVANANRAGGQFSVEQRLSSTVTIAADWFTGKHASGFFTPGIIWAVTNQLTIYGAYGVANNRRLEGNSALLFEVGYRF